MRINALSIFRIYTRYEPLRVFMSLAAIVGLAAMIIWARYAYFYVFEDDGAGHVQSLILGAVLFNAAMLLAAMGVIGDILSANSTMVQRVFERVRRIELQLGTPPSHYEPGQPGAAAEHPPTTGANAGPQRTEDREAVKV